MSNTSNSSGFVVIAEFLVKAGSMAAFLEAARKDASQSLSKEPGCSQFDIVLPESSSDSVLFYEVYDSREAFDAHLATPHVAEFRQAFPCLIMTERPVRFGSQFQT